MGIVRNLVVRFKNWYKDIVNEVVNNMNTRELTDDVKLRDNSKGKRPLAGLVAFVLMATPVLGLAENSEVELTTETKIENQVKDIPLGEVTDEAVVSMLATPTDEMSDEEEKELSQYNTMDEYLLYEQRDKELVASLVKKKFINSEKLNDLAAYKILMKSKNIRKELISSGRITSTDAKSEAMRTFRDLLEQAIVNPSLRGDFTEFILNGMDLSEEERKEKEELIEKYILTNESLRKGKVTKEVLDDIAYLIKELSHGHDIAFFDDISMDELEKMDWLPISSCMLHSMAVFLTYDISKYKQGEFATILVDLYDEASDLGGNIYYWIRIADDNFQNESTKNTAK